MKPLLAATCKSIEEVQLPCLLSYKLDGIRCLIKDGEAVSRSLKPIPNEFVRNTLRGLNNFDGELIVGDPTRATTFSDTASGIMSRGGEPDFTYFVFDRWDRGNEPFEDTMLGIEMDIDNLQNKRVDDLWQQEAESVEDITDFEQRAVELGYEGIMIRSLDGRYKFGRSTLREGILLKLKRYLDMEGVVVGFEELMHNENVEFINALGHTERNSKKEGLVAGGVLGALVIKLGEPYTDAQLSVGTGFDAAQRETIWANRDALLGKTVTIKYSPSVRDLPRFPVFLRFREE